MNENIDILTEIISERCGSHYISLQCKDLLVKQLDKLRTDGTLIKHNMTYTYIVLDDCILLMLYNSAA